MTPRAQSGIPDPVAAILEAQLDKYLADQARKFPYGSPAQRRSDLEREAPPSRQPGPAPQPAEEPGPQAEEAAQTHPGPLLPAIGAPSPFLAARKVTEQAPSPRLESTEPDEAHCLHGSSRAAGHESDTEVERRQREDPTVAMWRPHAALLTAARGRPHSPSLGSRSTRAMHRLSYNGHYAGALAPAPAALSESTGGGAAGSYRCATEVGGPRLSLGIIGGRGAGILFNGVDSSSFPRRRLLANHQSMDGTPDLLQKPLQQLDSLPYINPGHSDWKERRQELKKRVLAMPLVQHVEALRDPQLPFVARVPDWKIGLG
ncbi:hypothetical protein HYH02_014722 [Chlamydomonas schloesseri]|uniref:Uncharacterized protein n=1 Tax=Chlamydomonas schloesseri TaxID=2026947 RepID=A0A835VVC0_9CHLO|nr:hypothetical protein HYH02_014722 [Chlamydomonas schloesseri]|eukprot:KAG2426869.1 hypothetical protein HYH02_014722 [Chlamydomonas schloesseri]